MSVWKVSFNDSCHFKNDESILENLDLELFYSELKRHNVSHYIYYLATDNIYRVRKRASVNKRT